MEVTPEKTQRLWEDWCKQIISNWDQKTLYNYALEQLKLSYISHVYKHQGHVPDFDAILSDISNYYNHDREEIEKYLNKYDITLDTFDH